MLSAPSTANHSHFTRNRNGEPGTNSSGSYDFLPSVSFDDLHASIESASTDFKLTQFPSPNGEGSILEPQSMATRNKSEKTPSGHTATKASNASNTSVPSAATATTRTTRSGSILRRPSTSSRQPSTSSIASSWSATSDAPMAPPPARQRRQSHYPPVSTTNTAKPPRKSIGPGVLTDVDLAARTTQRRRPSLVSERGGTDSTTTSLDGSDSSRQLNTSRATKAKSVQPPPRAAQAGSNNNNNHLSNALGTESNRLSLATRSPRIGGRGATPSSGGNKRASMMPGTGHSTHASGLGARTISPTDTRRMKRMSMMPQSQSMNLANIPPPPPPVCLDARAGTDSPAVPPRKTSATPTSARTTPDAHRKSYTSGLAIGSNTSLNSARNSTGPIQPRMPQQPASSRLPAPKNNGAQNSSGPGDESEEVPPVPAIPKAYESPKESALTDTYFVDKKKSALGSLDNLSIHSNSTSSISMPTQPEPTKVRRRPSARKSAHVSATSGEDTKQSGQTRRQLQPLTLPPLNLAPLSMPTAAKVAALNHNNSTDRLPSPPLARQIPKTPTTPMNASKSTFFQSRYDDAMELPALRSSSSVHHSHRKNNHTPGDASSSDSSSIIKEPKSKPSISPYLSSSLPKGGFEFEPLKRSKTSDYTSNTTNGAQTSKKPNGPRPVDTTTSVPKSPAPPSATEQPPTPSSMSSLRRKLSMSWKRSGSKGNAGGSNDSNDKSMSDHTKHEALPRIPVSSTTNNLASFKTRSPSTSGSGLDAKTRKSSAGNLTYLSQSKSDTWGRSKEPGDSATMPITRNGAATKMLKPKTSSSTLRLAGAYTANDLDKDDMAANDEMRKMGSRRKETDIAARTLDALRKRASPKERVGPHEAIRIAMLNIYERGEIVDYNDIYFCGTQSAHKVVGDLQSDAPNFGYDDERGDYTIVSGDHLAYRYEIVDVLGKGSFGQVVRCIDHKLGKLVAIKIIRNKKRFHQQALVEVNILQKLREWVRFRY